MTRAFSDGFDELLHFLRRQFFVWCRTPCITAGAKPPE
jgi:hypothetical protein